LIKQLWGPKFRDIISDPRTEEEKMLDYKYGEDVVLTMGAPATKRIKTLPIKPLDQSRTSACVAYSAMHARDLQEGVTMRDPLPWYRTRRNYSGPGMFLKDGLSLMAHAEPVSPEMAPPISESFANSMPLVPVMSDKRKEDYEYVSIKAYDTDAVIASVTSGNPTMIGFYSTGNEWDEEMEVKDFTTQATAPVRHAVIALPNSYHTHNGKQWVSVIDSFPNKGHFLRHISIDFLKERMFFGGGFYHRAPVRKKKVTAQPLNFCRYGQRNDGVLELQRFLTQVGLMSTVHNTGYYGNITAKAVLTWQLANVDTVNKWQLDQWKGYYWGPASVKKFNELYS